MIEPREYQKTILETAKKKNTLVVLPTGIGKTLIALMLANERLKIYPDSKILFLAPTRPLVEQHYDYFKKNFNLEEMHIFTGKINSKKREEIWKNARVIFSTPQCIHNDLKHNLISLENVSLLIEDECHRCLKNYSYTFVAIKYVEQSKIPRILGLTASPGSEAKKIQEICDNLKIEAVETRTRESEDVKPYLQKLTFEAIRVDFPQELKDIRVLLKIIYDKKIKELQSRKLIFRMVTKITLLDLQKRLRNMVISGNHHFNVLRGISICAQAIKIQYALELLETQTVETFFNYMKDLYDQAKNKKSKGVVQIVNSREFQDAYIISIKLYETGFEHPKIEKLKEIVEKEIKQNKNSKLLIFSQYRDSVYKINSELEKIGLKTAIFIGQAKKKDIGLSQKEQQLTLWKFKHGEINCLVSTSIGEEGLDIPEVNAVIFYEPIPSAIRKIQRAGRTARLKPGKLIILITKDTRDESHYWASHHKEKKMHQAIEEIKNGLDKKKEHKTLLDFKNF